MGILEGKPFPENFDFNKDNKIKGIENFEEVKNRRTNFLRD